MAEPKKPSVAFRVTVIVVIALVAYPLSTGPMQWVYCKAGKPRWLWNATKTVYAPLVWTLEQCPFEVSAIYRDYVKWWTPAK